MSRLLSLLSPLLLLGWTPLGRCDLGNYVSHYYRQHDCVRDYSVWKSAWTADKKDWCCRERGLGCPEINYPDVYPGAFPKAYQDVNIGRYPFYPDEVGTDFVDPGDHELTYDCQAGYTHWRVGWSRKKKAWCCRFAGLGCAQVTYPDIYPGAFSPESHEVHPHRRPDYYPPTIHVDQYPSESYHCLDGNSPTWSSRKQQWCCQRKDIGCHQYEVHEPYDCMAGEARWRDGWSASKKEWCCAHKSKGCEHEEPVHPFRPILDHIYHHIRGTDSHRAEPYDCNAGYSNWEVGWSTAKKAWCCDNYHRGCPLDEHYHHDQAFHCHVGLDHFPTTWSAEKRSWCCKNAGIGCRALQPGHIIYNKYDADLTKEMTADNKEEPHKSLLLLRQLGKMQVIVFAVAGCLGVAGTWFAVRSWGRRADAVSFLDIDGPGGDAGLVPE